MSDDATWGQPFKLLIVADYQEHAWGKFVVCRCSRMLPFFLYCLSFMLDYFFRQIFFSESFSQKLF